MPRPTAAEYEQAERLMNLTAMLDDVDIRLRMIELRTRQAIDRYGAHRLLEPVFGEVDGLRIAFSKMRGELLRDE